MSPHQKPLEFFAGGRDVRNPESAVTALIAEVHDLKQLIRFMGKTGISVRQTPAGFYRCWLPGKGHENWFGLDATNWLGAIKHGIDHARGLGQFAGEWEGPDWRI